MAGEWIKVESATMDKPEVIRAARKLGYDRDLILGKLVRLWSWFDINSVDGVVDGAASTDVDALVSMPGFSAVMKEVGWLHFDDDAERVWLPNFDRHNGETAKKRALKNKRQTRWRQQRDVREYGHVDVVVSTVASTREEKRREEEKKDSYESSSATPADCPHQQIIDAYEEILPMLPRVRRDMWAGSQAAEALKARWREDPKRQDITWWRKLFERIRDRCPHLLGHSGANPNTGKVWHADLRWIVKRENFTKILEGRYVDQRAA